MDKENYIVFVALIAAIILCSAIVGYFFAIADWIRFGISLSAVLTLSTMLIYAMNRVFRTR